MIGREDRGRELALIHVARKELGLDDDLYRDMLWVVARVRSAGDLDQAGRRAVIDHLKRCGFRPSPGGRGRARPNEWAWVDRAAEGKRKMLRKIIVLARSRGKAYVDGICRRMFGVERLEFADESQLHKIVSALTYDAKRHADEPAR